MEDAIDRVLELLSDTQMRALARACAGSARPRGSLDEAVMGASPAAHDAVARLHAAWTGRQDLPGAGVSLALLTGLRARISAESRRARPVWTGPGATGEQRLTAAVLHELVRGATQRVVVVSFAAFTLPELADDLAAAVDRGCEVDVIFETEEDSEGAYAAGKSVAYGAVAGLRRWRWPALERPAPGALLHAKVLIADGERALVGSANLTHRALQHNLEAGVLIEDAAVASELEAHVRSLMRDGRLVMSQ